MLVHSEFTGLQRVSPVPSINERRGNLDGYSGCDAINFRKQ